MAEHFLNLGKNMEIQTNETQKSINNINQEQIMPRYVEIKLPKDKDKETFRNSKRKSDLSHTREPP